jgi:hypothetical protein
MPVSRTLKIEGAERSAACSAAAKVCVDDEAPEPSCEVANKRVSQGVCEIGETCTSEIEIDSGVTATVESNYWGSCSLSEADQFSCQCSGSAEFGEYLVTASSTSDLCDSWIDFCKSGSKPELTGPEVCIQESASATGTTCEASTACSQTADLGGGVALIAPVTRFANCERLQDGVVRCSCSTGVETFFYEAALTTVDRDVCLTAISSCSPATTIESNGEVACTVASQSARTLECEAELDCTQPVKIAGGEYTGHGRLRTACRRAAAGEPWSCGCATSKSSKTFELGEVERGWDACSQAALRCPEEVDVYIGPSPEFVELPPLP